MTNTNNNVKVTPVLMEEFSPLTDHRSHVNVLQATLVQRVKKVWYTNFIYINIEDDCKDFLEIHLRIISILYVISCTSFLKRCRDSSITPTGLQLESSVSTPRAKLIIHKIGQALLRERIANTRHQLHTMEQDIQTSKVNLSQLLELADLRKCQAFITSTAGKTFQSTRKKQIVKFNKLLANSHKSTNQTTPTGTKDTVINLSNHPLTETEHKVLSLGLNFAVSPKKIPNPNWDSWAEPQRTKSPTAQPPQPNISKPERATIRDLRYAATRQSTFYRHTRAMLQ